MNFFRKLIYILGFGDEEMVGEPANSAEVSQPSTIAVPVMPAVPNVQQDAPIEVSDEIMHKIFDRVVEVTNTAVPAYFKSSVNPEQQKKFLYDALDESVKEYLIALDQKSQDKCMALWQAERDELKKKMDTLSQRAADLETKRAEMNEQKLSSDRQRRALSERVHDLETKVLSLEAEKEQFEIENRGLVNKAKVVSVYEADIEKLKEELDALRKSSSPDAAKAEIDRLTNEIECVKAENVKLKDACEAAKLKDKMSESMLNDLQKRASDSIQNAKDSDKLVDDLKNEIAVKDAQIADLNKAIEEKDARLADDEQTFEEYEKIAEQLALFQDVKDKFEAKISSLKTEVETLRKENDTLRSTVKDNLYDHAEQQKAMKEQIDSLKSAPIAGADFSFDDDMM